MTDNCAMKVDNYDFWLMLAKIQAHDNAVLVSLKFEKESTYSYGCAGLILGLVCTVERRYLGCLYS